MPCFRFLCSRRQEEDDRTAASSLSSQTVNSKRSPDVSTASHAAAAPLHHRFPSLQTESSSSSSPLSAASDALVAAARAVAIPSRTLSPSQTTTRLQPSQAASSLVQPWARSRQDSVELVPVSSEPAEAAVAGAAGGKTAEETKSVSAQSSDAAIKAAFTAPLPSRRLFPSAPPASIAATIAESSRGDAAAGVASSPSTDSSISSTSSSSSSPVPPAAPAPLPPRPPPHPQSRRLSNPAPAAPSAVTSRPHSSSISSSPAPPAPAVFSASQPSTPTSKPPQPQHQTPSPSSATKRPTAPSSTPLRARRLQRHRALSSSSPHSSLFPRASYIAASPTLTAFFSSPAAASVMTQRLMAGGIFLHHEAASSCYRHVFANSGLTRLHYVDVAAASPSLLLSLPAAAAAKLPHILCSSIIKLSRGLGTRSLIEKQAAMTESGCGVLLPASQLLSLSTPTVVLDLECCGESERDEWWLTFDWLLWTWNQRRMLSQQAGAAVTAAGAGQKPGGRPTAGGEGRKGSWLGGVVGLYEQQERLLRHDRQRQRRDVSSPIGLLLQSAIPSAAVAGRPPVTADVVRSGQSRAADGVSGSGAVSDRELYALLSLYVSDIEQVREANRLLLVEDCAAMIDMQRQIDALRDENVAIIEELRPDNHDG